MQKKSQVSYKLRNKTKERLSEKQQEALLELIDKSIKSTKDEVEKIIWFFIYLPQIAGIYNGFLGDELTKNEAFLVCAEIVRNYRRSNHEWDFGRRYIVAPYDTLKSISKINKMARGNSIIVHCIMHKLEDYLGKNYNTKKIIKSTIYMLKSTEKKVKYGGLRRIGCNYDEADFLMPYAECMSEALNEMYEKRNEIMTK